MNLKKGALLFIIVLGTFSLSFANSDVPQQTELYKPFTSTRNINPPAVNNILPPESVIKMPPVLDDDIVGGGTNGIGRESAPITDSTIIFPLLISGYLFVKILKNNKVKT